MNALRKKSGVGKYQSLFTNGATEDELKLAISGDEKEYTPDEVNEIAAEIMNPKAPQTGDGDQGGDKVPPIPTSPTPAKETAKAKAKVVKTESEEDQAVYEEWRMERTADGKLEKLKIVRGKVKISEQEAETLNAGASSNGAVNPIMYLKAE